MSALRPGDIEELIGRKVLMIVPMLLRAQKRQRGWRNTNVFYFRNFWEIHPGQAALFEERVKHVVFMCPPTEDGAGAWNPLVEAIGMWLALIARIYLVAGPRTIAKQQWLQVAEKTRQHIGTYI
ncbi:hypothetical protein Q1695_015497 [Nippostrongylus brasiliensis]|nr:hypothetical protein Q1695_015497 [Nippostrongylus brasiliensis]